MFLWRLPPIANAAPSTRSALPTIEPMSVALTIVNSPAATRKQPTMSSVRLLSVAFIRPPRWGPMWIASCSVADPISAARGTSAIAAVMKVAVSWCAIAKPAETGTNTSSQ